METLKKSVAARSLGKGGMNRWSTEGLSGYETNVFNIIVMDTCHYPLVQIHGVHNAWSEPQGEPGLGWWR